MNSVNIIGAGLAGSEASYQLAKRGVKITLFEMKPINRTPAHLTDDYAEVVCSNSFKSKDIYTSSGLLKYELTEYDSLLIKVAYDCAVPAGSALAIDRAIFSKKVTEYINSEKNITVKNIDVDTIDFDIPTIIATGPLSSDNIINEIKPVTGEGLYFADAIAPIIDAESLDYNIGFFMGRYNKGGDDYFNIPITEDEYNKFYEALITAEYQDYHDFENIKYFDGCMPIEVMAKRGKETLLFGPLKPVGLIDPKTNKRPFAVMQLRKENINGTAYNIVGFQTKMKIGEQKRVFSLIHGLRNAEYLRYGGVHRNTYINSPSILDYNFQCKSYKNIFFAGQITGVEGYVESIASGLMAGTQLYRFINGKEPIDFGDVTALGGLANHISGRLATSFDRKNRYTPSNFNHGLLKPFDKKIKDKASKNELIFNRAEEYISKIKESL